MNAWKKLGLSSLLWMFFWDFSLAAKDISLVPSSVIQDFLKSYTSEELRKIEQDRENVRRLCFAETTLQKRFVATAGGPGASKTTVLETYLHDRPGFVYVDPDQRALRFMIHTYASSINNYTISQSSSFQALLKQSYEKWRGASNYIANSLLNEAFAQGVSIAHGTTSTAKTMGQFYQRLKQKGYHITLLLCVSPEKNRQAAIQHRAQNQAFVQSTAEDVIQKGKLFFENFPLYFQWADEVHLYWVEEFSKPALCVGTWTPKMGLSKGHDLHHKDFEKLKSLYEEHRHTYNSSLPSFDALVSIQR